MNKVKDEIIAIPLADGPPPPPKAIPASLKALGLLKENPGAWYHVRRGAPTSSVSWWKDKGCQAHSRYDPETRTYNYYAMWPKEDGND